MSVYSHWAISLGGKSLEAFLASCSVRHDISAYSVGYWMLRAQLAVLQFVLALAPFDKAEQLQSRG